MSSENLENNISVIQQRWPDLISLIEKTEIHTVEGSLEQNTLVLNNLQLTSNYDRLAEANLQASLIDELASHATVYGPALGDTVQVLLQRSQLLKLTVVVLNTAVFLHSLNAIDHTLWLNDKRVELCFANELSEISFPFCANPTEVKLADIIAKKLADKVQLELDQTYRESFFKTSLNEQSLNIERNRKAIESDKGIEFLEIEKQSEVFIAAAGPTLELHLDYLVEKKPFIIAVDAAVRTLIKNQIIPNIVVSIDYTSFQFFNDIDTRYLENTSLIYFPSVDPKVLSYWPSNKYCSYSKTPLFKELTSQLANDTLFSAGSVIHPAIDLALYLGANKVILLGADFAFVGNKSHARGHEIVASHELSTDVAKETVLNGMNQLVPTMLSLKNYLIDLERFIEKHPTIEFLNGSNLGAKIAGTQLWTH